MHLKRTATILRPDQSRVLLRPFSPGGPERIARIIARIMALPEERAGQLLDQVSAEFSHRHQQIPKRFLERFEQVRESLAIAEEISERRRLLIGSYFLAEYSLESAALFNPSIVPHLTRQPCRRARCGLSSACAPPGRATSPPSRFELVLFIPTCGSRYCRRRVFSPSQVRPPIPGTRRRCSGENSVNWD